MKKDIFASDVFSDCLMVSRGEGSAVVALILEGLAILFMFIFFNFEHLSSAYFVQ